MPPATVTVTVLYFASLRDRLGREREIVELPARTTDRAVLDALARLRPEAADLLATCRLAVDHAFAAGAVELRAESEVAVIPPVSGG